MRPVTATGDGGPVTAAGDGGPVTAADDGGPAVAAQARVLAHERDAARLVRALTAAGHTVAVAESLTGGAVCEAITAVPGASACLRGGVVAYAADLKAELLDVPGALLEMHGTVHPQVARAMASGVRRRLHADYGIATTGVAGPGPQEGHPAGTFHVAVEGPAGSEVVSLRPAAPGHAGHASGALVSAPGERSVAGDPTSLSGRPASGRVPSRAEVRAAARDAALALAVALALSRAGDDGADAR